MIGVSISIVENSTDVSTVPEIVNLTISWSVLNSNVGEVNVGILTALEKAFVPTIIGDLNTLLSESSFSFAKQIETLELSSFTQFEFVQGSPGFMCIEFDLSLSS